jgi:hypothetical protein
MPKAARIDPELLRQLDEVGAGAAPVGAVVYLRPPKGQAALSSDDLEQVTKTVLQRVAKNTGEKPDDFNLFKNLGMFAVVGRPAFLRELVKQPEVKSAVANKK